MPDPRQAAGLRSPSRSALSVAAVLAVVTAIAGPAQSTRATEDPAAELAAAEAQMIRLISEDRTASGLVPLRGDARLTAIARERSAEMAVTGQLSHTTAGGGTVFDMLTARGISWMAAGEALAWNDVPGPLASASMAHSAWIASPPHRAILRAGDLNYVGVGAAYNPSTGALWWTAVAIRQADRTGAVGRIRSLARTTASTPAGTTAVAVTWSGNDVRLQVLTAGLLDFQVQRRINGGSWRTILGATTATRIVQTLTRGWRYEYRARARDRRGNYGAWSAALAIAP